MSAVAVIVAAGKGERFGDSGKVLVSVLGRAVLEYSLDAFEQSTQVSEIILVVGAHTETAVRELVDSGHWTKTRQVVLGGESRQQSTANGVAAASADVDMILVHDAARPLIRPEQIDACVVAASEHGGAILAAPLTDTIKRVQDHRIVETADRSSLWGAQTPQVFRADLMRAMTAYAESTTQPVTDEASLAEALGYPVQIVMGDASNIKITHPNDLIVVEALLRSRKDQCL